MGNTDVLEKIFEGYLEYLPYESLKDYQTLTGCFIWYLKKVGVTWPEEKDIENFSLWIKAKYSPEMVSRMRVKAKEFLSYLASMNKTQSSNSNQEKETHKMTQKILEVPEVETVKRIGRPRKSGNKEIRSEKISLYLPATLKADLDKLLRIKNQTLTDLAVSLLTSYVDEHSQQLEIFNRALDEINNLEKKS